MVFDSLLSLLFKYQGMPGPMIKIEKETVDEETGDWTLDTARQKLHEYLAKRQITLGMAHS